MGRGETTKCHRDTEWSSRNEGVVYGPKELVTVFISLSVTTTNPRLTAAKTRTVKQETDRSTGDK